MPPRVREFEINGSDSFAKKKYDRSQDSKDDLSSFSSSQVDIKLGRLMFFRIFFNSANFQYEAQFQY